MRVEPATIRVNIIQAINNLMVGDGRYLRKDDFRYRRVLHDCDKLIHVDPAQGYVTRGMARALVGDLMMGGQDFANALRLAPGLADDIRFTWAHFSLNMGDHSSALTLFKQAVSPTKPEFSQRHLIGEVVGAVSYLSGLFKEAESMGLHYETHMDEQDIHTKAGFLKDNGLSDEKLAVALDLAGKVVREHSLIPGSAYRAWIADFDGDPFYMIELHVNCPPKEAADMVSELSEKMALLDEDEAYHSIHITFEADNGGH